MKDHQVREKFIELRGQGWSFDRIAKELGVSKPTLIHWAREYQIEINNLKSLGLDGLCEKYALTNQKRVELFGELLERLKKEVLNRDLSSIPTHKAFELVLKLSEAVKEEAPKIQFQKEEISTLEDMLKKVNEKKMTVSWEA